MAILGWIIDFIVLLHFQYSLQFIFITIASFTSHRIIYIAFSPSLSLRHATTGFRWHPLLSCFRCHSHWWKTYCRLSWLKHRCCFENFTTVQQTLLKSILKKCFSLCEIFEINVFQEIHLWKQALATGMLKVVDITTWNLTYQAK